MKQYHRKIFWGTAIILLFTLTLYTQNKEGIKIKKSDSENTNVIEGDSMKTKIVKSEEDWCRILTPEQYEVLRQKGTERAFTGKYYNHKETGIYTCSACGNKLFKSATKYDSGSGWPSFWDVVDKDEVKLIEDRSYGMKRIEVLCKKCDSHLGHVFDDGPEPTGIRYCINSVSLNFIPDDSVKNQK